MVRKANGKGINGNSTTDANGTNATISEVATTSPTALPASTTADVEKPLTNSPRLTARHPGTYRLR